MRRAWVLFLIAWVALAGGKPQAPAQLQSEGESRFIAYDFRAAARAFEQALLTARESAGLHFWAGTSYARLAVVTSPLHACSNARKARTHLEAAVRLDPANPQYLAELFDFYLDSPEWFDGGLDRAAALLERMGPDDGGPASPSSRLAEARKEFAGGGWRLEKGILRLGGLLGRFVPQR